MMARPGRRDWHSPSVGVLIGVPPAFLEGLKRGIVEREAFDDRRRLNVRPDPHDPRDRLYRPNLVPIRAKMLPPGVAAADVRDQGGEGSCTGQALAAVIDLQNAGRGHPFRASARMLFQMALAYDGMPIDRLAGSSLRHALKGFFHNGVCSEGLAPYVIGEPAWRLDVAMAKEARGCGLGSYYRLENTLYDYHAALNETQSIYCAAMLHDGWRRQAVARHGGAIRLPDARPELCGGHAFAIVGYDADGFFVLNSWGPGWGQHGGRPGIAHWSYEDWQSHVLDAWVLRLQVPSPKTFHLSGGFFELSRRPFGHSRATMPRIEINGHYIHTLRGRYVRAGPYWNKERTVAATADWLKSQSVRADGSRDYDHLLFIADSGLEPLARVVERAAVLTPLLKTERIYPVFLIWHTEALARIERVLSGQADDFLERAAGNATLANDLVEAFTESYLKPVWADLAADAERTAAGDAGQAMRDFWRSGMARPGGIKVHFAAHSTGSFLLGHLIGRAARDGLLGGRGRAASALASVSLLAPACPLDFFRKAYRPARRALDAGAGAAAAIAASPAPAAGGRAAAARRRRRIAVYVLSGDRERADRFGPYAGSFLSLAAAAFCGASPPLGLARVVADEKRCRRCHVVLADGGAARPTARSHLDWCDDEATLIDLVARIRGA